MRNFRISPRKSVLFSLAALLGYFGAAKAEPQSFETELLEIQQAWAQANYQLRDEAQEQAFKELEARVKSFTSQHQDRAEAYIWQGIVLSTEAGVVGGLGALDLAKQSKSSLEQALQLNENALDGSAHTSLGTLYYKVPGWPFGFGDDDLAREHLEKALAVNPNGIDPNYFYGEFLYEEGEYKAAKKHLQRALAAPARPTRPLADQERKREIQALLQQVEKKLKRRRS
ncbi:tetratricopeptide repeat protein [Pseudidiomarina taiwanensis]|uniref:tetratricopeptide repeat protein n=1 Tax=Pseudidiomarina taiwanensis TaxID=337250 RepID=UPI003B847D77